jgi:hypothetical protein
VRKNFGIVSTRADFGSVYPLENSSPGLSVKDTQPPKSQANRIVPEVKRSSTSILTEWKLPESINI